MTSGPAPVVQSTLDLTGAEAPTGVRPVATEGNHPGASPGRGPQKPAFPLPRCPLCGSNMERARHAMRHYKIHWRCIDPACLGG